MYVWGIATANEFATDISFKVREVTYNCTIGKLKLKISVFILDDDQESIYSSAKYTDNKLNEKVGFSVLCIKASVMI